MPHENPKKEEAYLPDADNATKIYAPGGSDWSEYEFYSEVDLLKGGARKNHIYPGEKKFYSTSGGRSSEKNAPFLTLAKTERVISLP